MSRQLRRVAAASRRGGARDFARLASRGVVLKLILLASGPLVARLLGPEGRGELALAMTIGLMAAQGVMAAIGVAAARAVAEAAGPARSLLRPHLVRWACYAVGAAVLAIAAASVVLRATDATGPTRLAIAAGCIALLSSWMQLLSAMLRGEGNLRAVTVIPILTTSLYVLGVVACFFLVPGIDVLGIVGIYLVGQVTGIVLSSRRLRPPETTVSVVDRRSLASTARRAWVTAINALGLGFDQIVVSVVLGTHALGLYVVAVSITNVPGMVLRTVAAMLMPRLVAASAESRRAMARRWLAAAAGLTLVIVLALEAVIGPAIRILFGAEFEAATPAARIMIIAWGFLAFRLMLTAVLQAQGRAGRASLVEIVATGVMVVAAVVGTHTIGIEGAALAMLVTAVLACLISLTQVQRGWADQPANN